MTQRVFNFSPGPAVLPEPVLRRAQQELCSLPQLGMSILEISHRSQAFGEILEEAKANLGKLLRIPDGYQVLFLQGGGRLQFSMIALSFGSRDAAAQYIVTGTWSKKAEEEARRLVKTDLVFDNGEDGYVRAPTDNEITIDPAAKYLYFTSNETIQGVQFATEPDAGDVPLICDASSDLLCRPIPIEKYALIYACAQKNAGPAGVTIVIARDDLIERSADNLPGYLDYRNHASENSLYNTAPTFAIYVVNLVCQWLLDEVGGLDQMYAQNQRKAAMLYDVIDESKGFYSGHASVASRSIMNVPFRHADDNLDSKFLAAAEQRQLCNLKGHRSVGGIRASIYNSMPLEGVERLRDFMREFAAENS